MSSDHFALIKMKRSLIGGYLEIIVLEFPTEELNPVIFGAGVALAEIGRDCGFGVWTPGLSLASVVASGDFSENGETR